MKLCVVLFMLAAALAPALAENITGTIEKIEKDQIQIRSGKSAVTLFADDKTTVMKGKATHDVSALAPGDEIRANVYGDERKVAVSISAKVTLTGVITEANSNHITLRPDRAHDTMFVFLQSATKYAVPRSQLTAGHRVSVTGWDTGEGVMEADKVAPAELDVPATTSRLRE